MPEFYLVDIIYYTSPCTTKTLYYRELLCSSGKIRAIKSGGAELYNCTNFNDHEIHGSFLTLLTKLNRIVGVDSFAVTKGNQTQQNINEHDHIFIT